jgi:DNA invertase Pin-like site-specific DNA recombinase
MKIAIYVRVSRGDLHTDNQRLKLEEYAKMKGYDYEVFEETESSRKTRPVKENLLNMLREGKFDGVLVYKLDRWARSLQELIMNIEELRSRNRQFIVLTQPIDTTNSAGMLMLQILGAFAEFEREIIRERTLAGLDRARAWGRKLGRPRTAEKMDTQELNKIRELYTQGVSVRQIALQLKISKYTAEKGVKIIKKETPPANLTDITQKDSV